LRSTDNTIPPPPDRAETTLPIASIMPVNMFDPQNTAKFVISPRPEGFILWFGPPKVNRLNPFAGFPTG
jgi:hypothetical protein